MGTDCNSPTIGQNPNAGQSFTVIVIIIVIIGTKKNMQSRIQCGVRGFCTWYPISLKPLTTTKFRPFLWTTRKSYLVPIYIGDQVSYTWPPPPCSEVPANGGTLADVECPTSSRLIIIDIINVILGSKKFDFPNLIMWIL